MIQMGLSSSQPPDSEKALDEALCDPSDPLPYEQHKNCHNFRVSWRLGKAPISGAWCSNEVERWLLFRCRNSQEWPTATGLPSVRDKGVDARITSAHDD